MHEALVVANPARFQNQLASQPLPTALLAIGGGACCDLREDARRRVPIRLAVVCRPSPPLGRTRGSRGLPEHVDERLGWRLAGLSPAQAHVVRRRVSALRRRRDGLAVRQSALARCDRRSRGWAGVSPLGLTLARAFDLGGVWRDLRLPAATKWYRDCGVGGRRQWATGCPVHSGLRACFAQCARLLEQVVRRLRALLRPRPGEQGDRHRGACSTRPAVSARSRRRAIISSDPCAATCALRSSFDAVSGSASGDLRRRDRDLRGNSIAGMGKSVVVARATGDFHPSHRANDSGATRVWRITCAWRLWGLRWWRAPT